MSRVFIKFYKSLKEFIKNEFLCLNKKRYESSSSGTIDGIAFGIRNSNMAFCLGMLKICTFLGVSIGGGVWASQAPPVSVLIEQSPEITHLEFKNRDIWLYKITQPDKNKISFEVDPLDDRSLVELKTLRTPFIEKVDVESGANLKQKITLTLAPEVESFDYITDQPARLVIDFFKQEKKPVVQPAKKQETKKIASQLPAKKTRKPASEFLASQRESKERKTVVALDGADLEYKRFEIKDYDIKESSIIASSLNMYIPFPMMSVPNIELEKILEVPNVYSFPVENTDENKKARLLLTLFKKGKEDQDNSQKASIEKPRTAVFLKALELFRKEFPESKYSETLRFMEADVYYDIWLKEKNPSDFDFAISLYTKLLLDIPNSPLHDRMARLVAYSYLNKKDYINALKWLQSYQNKYPDSPDKYRTQMSLGEVFSHLGNLEESIKIFSQLEGQKELGPLHVEASFRKGDAYAFAKKYSEAIQSYEVALKNNSEVVKSYPNAVYNSAESLFLSKKEKDALKKSLDTYIEFMRKFPKEDHVSFAMERVGELLEILGADESVYDGAFLETIYRYPESQAAGLAKMRLLRARLKNMKDEDIADELNKIDEFLKTSSLPSLKEFKSIMISDGYYKKEDYDKTLNELITFVQKNPLSNYLDIFKKRIVQSLRDQMSSYVNNKEYLKVFQSYGKNKETWLKESKRLDVEYLLGQSFEKMGVSDEAVKKYQELKGSLEKIYGTNEAKERGVFETLPSPGELDLRLASVHVFKGEHSKALELLKKIQDKDLQKDESKIEKTYLSSVVYDKMGDHGLAMTKLKELTESWNGNPQKLAGVYLRLAQIQGRLNQNKEAIQSINKTLQISKNSQEISDQDIISSYQLKADLSLKLKDGDVVIDTYKELLDRYEDSHDLYASRYHLGKAFFDKGNLKEAEKTWSPLSDRVEARLWHQLAQENLNNRNWNDDYKKYTNRIPAMVDGKKEQTGDRK